MAPPKAKRAAGTSASGIPEADVVRGAALDAGWPVSAGPRGAKDLHSSRSKLTEVQGMEGDVIVMQDVLVFEQTDVVEGKIQGKLNATGIRPKFAEKFETMGIHLPPGLFGFSR
jgi:hypothetical protein